jgi:hypothetical protein
MNESLDLGAPVNRDAAIEPAHDEGVFTWGTLEEGELLDAISLAFDDSLEALNELGKIKVRDNETGDVIWDADGALVLVP